MVGELITLSRGLHRIAGTESGCYPAALAAALGESIGLERPQWRVRHLDLPGGAVQDDAGSSSSRFAGCTTSRRGMAVGPPAGAHAAPGGLCAPPAPRPQPGSCWLVTGGLGGIGRALIRDLAEELDLTLLVGDGRQHVTGRTPRGAAR